MCDVGPTLLAGRALPCGAALAHRLANLLDMGLPLSRYVRDAAAWAGWAAVYDTPRMCVATHLCMCGVGFGTPRRHAGELLAASPRDHAPVLTLLADRV
jgi:hypothetical protein